MINKFYGVYMNLVLVDVNGDVMAVSKPDVYPSSVNANVKKDRWFYEAMNTASGADYIVDDVADSAMHNNASAAIYSASVRRGGELASEVLGVLGVFFDWGPQSKGICNKEPTLSEEEWTRSRVLLLDGKRRIIQSSDGLGIYTQFDLDTGGQQHGSYYDSQGNIVAFAQTIGYEEYDGLGWFGVVVQKPISREEIEKKLAEDGI